MMRIIHAEGGGLSKVVELSAGPPIRPRRKITSIRPRGSGFWGSSDRVVTATVGGTVTTNTYDALNRLIQVVTNAGSGARYSYAGYSDAPVAMLDHTGNFVDQLVGLPGGVALILQTGGRTWTWNYTNLQGDTTATTDIGGALTSGPVTYDSWGNLNPGQTAPDYLTGATTLGAYATSGKLTNVSTGAILLGARMFNPSEARFLSVDPMQGGCANAYTYAFGSPNDQKDLTGTQVCDIADPNGITGNCNFTSCSLIIGPQEAGRIAQQISTLPSVAAQAAIGFVVCGAIGSIATPVVGAIARFACAIALPIAGQQLADTVANAAKNGDYVDITLGFAPPSISLRDVSGKGGRVVCPG